MGRGDLGAGRHLLDPAELPAPLRDLRLRLRATPQVVYVGYTPGYYSVYVSDGVVVYGTGYSYVSWDGTVWYGPPVTYGFATSPTYTPWTGWVMGFGFGLAFGVATAGWGWGCYPWWGPYHNYGAAYGRYGGAAAWGPGGWAATTGNVYRRWGTRPPSRATRPATTPGPGTRGGAARGCPTTRGPARWRPDSAASSATPTRANYAYGARGAAVNPRTGQAVSAGRVTTGTSTPAGRLGGLHPRPVGRRCPGRQRPVRVPRRLGLPQHRGRLAAEQRRRLGQREPADPHPDPRPRAGGPVERQARVNNFRALRGIPRRRLPRGRRR